MWFFLYAIAVIAIAIGLIRIILKLREVVKANDKLHDLGSETGLSTNDFLKMRNFFFGRGHRSTFEQIQDFPGVYVILNQTKHRYYVGQSNRVLDGINRQLTGKGNLSLHNDIKQGDRAIYHTFRLKGSPCSTLASLKKMKIAEYGGLFKRY